VLTNAIREHLIGGAALLRGVGRARHVGAGDRLVVVVELIRAVAPVVVLGA